MKRIVLIVFCALALASIASPHVHAATVIAINSGGGAVVPFVADVYFSGGNTYATSNAITISGVTNAAPMAVYQTERWQSSFSYTIPGLTPSSPYTVRLHFAEIYFSASGRRTFNVDINSARVLSAFDIFVAAGGANRAIVREFAANANASGQIIVAFSSVVDNAKVNGIEILGSAPGTTPSIVPNTPTATATASRTYTPTATRTSTATPTPEPPLFVFCAAGICARDSSSINATIIEIRSPNDGTLASVEACDNPGQILCTSFSPLGTIATQTIQGVPGSAMFIGAQDTWHRVTLGGVSKTFYVPSGALNYRVNIAQ